MVATRSRNKLERQAHMSIHHTVEMTAEVPVIKGFTRDRFGKEQTIHKPDEKK